MSVTENKAVFLSYASEDAAAARQICDALRIAGAEVWFDQSELGGGDQWDAKIRGQIASCALFVPLISAHTEERLEGYFRVEWKIAAQRTHAMAEAKAFLLPVLVDDTRDNAAHVPPEFKLVQWTKLPLRSAQDLPPASGTMAAFVARVKKLLDNAAVPARSGPSEQPAANPAAEISAGGQNEPVIPDYKLIRAIGQGSYGDVWLARGLTGVYRAIKIVWRNRFRDAEPFEREFKGLQKFTTMSRPESGQLALLHVGQNEAAGYFYYVMELADDVETGSGINPAKYTPLTLREIRARRGRLPAAECVNYSVELARALAGLHSRGLVHRDIKPSNVILVGGVPKLADIGLVASTGDALTYVGTEGFVPPEGPGKLGADVYAFGRLMYELATGFDRTEFPRLPPDLDQMPDRQLLFELNEIILRACEASPEQRYRDASAVLADLLTLQAGHSVRRRGRNRLGRGLLAAGVIAGSLVAGFTWRSRSVIPKKVAVPQLSVAAKAKEKSVAVLAFANLSGDQAQEYFSDGISEELLNALARVHGLKVSARTSAFHFKGTDTPIKEIARQLGVAYVVEGSVRKSGNRVRIDVQLVDAADGFQVWSENFDRELIDIFAVQDEITSNILGAVKVTVLGEDERPRAVPTNLDAYNFYLQAQALIATRTEANLRDAVRLYRSTLALAPDYVPAWVGLAWARALLPSYAGMNGAEAKVISDESKRAAQRALELDPRNAEALAILGWVRAWLDWEWEAGLAELNHAAELAPNSPGVLNCQGDIVRMEGNLDQALEIKMRAWQLNPLEPAYNWDVASVYLVRNEYAEAIRWAQASARIAPQNLLSYGILILASARSGQFDRMHQFIATARENVHDNDGRLLLLETYAAFKENRLDEARRLLPAAAKLVEAGKASPSYLGYCYLLVGEAEQANTWFRRAIELRDPTLNWDVFIDYEVIAANPLTRAILEVPGIREGRALRQRNRPVKAVP